MVHRGFLQTWLANKFNEQVLSRILEITSQGKVAPEDFQVLITGDLVIWHSPRWVFMSLDFHMYILRKLLGCFLRFVEEHYLS